MANLCTRLKTRRNPLLSAFTIVELLIVIVIIAILATITIVAYNGITSRAHDASTKSNLNS
ncbi:MAG: prepilin-type N-terminal cleavage/methylation domain-containing protein, partial [Candidatus Saccharimonas sp.]